MTTTTVRRVLAAGLLAAVPVTIAAAGSRPFKASIYTLANPTPTGDPCILVNTEHGTLHATHLGRATWDSSEQVDQCSNPEGAEIEGTFTITAADGDQLFGTYETLGHFDFPNSLITFAGQYTITGGTGRFAQAGGGGALEGSGALAPPFDVFGQMSGRLSY